jgi:hypothetical protein
MMMKRFAFVLSLVAIISAGPALLLAADNFPNPNAPQQGPAPTAVQKQMYYGYVPPAPIRHTWPGGYKVIFHELGNTLMEHILGQY